MAKKNESLATVSSAPISRFTDAQIDLIKRQTAKNATNDELELFMHLANKYNLDPFAKEIWFIKFGNQSPTIFTSRDGYLKNAHNNPNFSGMRSGSVHENDEYEEDNNGVKHKHGKPRGEIIGAYAVVYRQDWVTPVIVFVNFKEYNNANNPTWKKYPTAMIIKVAEAMALKRAFPLDGLALSEDSHVSSALDNVSEPEVVDTEAIQLIGLISEDGVWSDLAKSLLLINTDMEDAGFYDQMKSLVEKVDQAEKQGCGVTINQVKRLMEIKTMAELEKCHAWIDKLLKDRDYKN